MQTASESRMPRGRLPGCVHTTDVLRPRLEHIGPPGGAGRAGESPLRGSGRAAWWQAAVLGRAPARRRHGGGAPCAGRPCRLTRGPVLRSCPGSPSPASSSTTTCGRPRTDTCSRCAPAHAAPQPAALPGRVPDLPDLRVLFPETLESSRGGEQAEASLYPQLVSAPGVSLLPRGRGLGGRGRFSSGRSTALPARAGAQTGLGAGRRCAQDRRGECRRPPERMGPLASREPQPSGTAPRDGLPLSLTLSNKPNPNQISVNNVKAGVVNGAGAPGQSPGAGRACESCYSKCPSPASGPPRALGALGRPGVLAGGARGRAGDAV